jgi:hypothetical protein
MLSKLKKVVSINHGMSGFRRKAIIKIQYYDNDSIKNQIITHMISYTIISFRPFCPKMGESAQQNFDSENWPKFRQKKGRISTVLGEIQPFWMNFDHFFGANTQLCGFGPNGTPKNQV